MIIRKFCSILIGLLPVIMIYKVPFTWFGLSTLAVAFLAVIAVINLGINGWKLEIDLVLTIFFAYLICRNIGNGYNSIFYFLAFAAIAGCRHGIIDIELTFKTIEFVATIVSLIVIIQALFHYIFGINIRTLYSFFTLDEYKRILGYSIRGELFRPSGLFLEPAHFAQYTVISLLFNMRKENISISRILVFTIAILFTTSGIGILMLIASYGYFLIIRTKKAEKRRRIQYFVSYVVIILLIAFIASRVSYIQLALQRILTADASGYNAINGRSVNWELTIGNMDGSQLLWGVGPRDYRVQGFMTGLNEILYYYGYIGLFLFVVNLFVSFYRCIRLKLWYGILCFVYAALIVSSDVVGFIMITFWFSLLSSHNNAEVQVTK